MKHTTSRGSAHAVIIIVLVIALVGVLGFVFWQNFIQKSESTSETQKQQTTSNVNESQSKQEKTLVLSRWGVEIPLTDETARLTAEARDNDYYEIKVPESVLFSDTAKTGTQVVGTVGRTDISNDSDKLDAEGTAGKTLRQAIKDGDVEGVIVDDYAYTFAARQQAAYLGGTDKEAAADKVLDTLAMKTLPEQFKKLRQIK